MEKVKAPANAGGRGQHNYREIEVKNADKELEKFNEYRFAKNSKDVVLKLHERIKRLDRKVRPDAVHALEYMVNTSGSKDLSVKEYQSYFADAEKWIIDRHGIGNILSVVHHYDEKTGPHLHALVIPVRKTKYGKTSLSADYYFGGKGKLSALQTDFHKKVSSHYGLDRGEVGSQARHQKVNKYHQQLREMYPDRNPEDIRKIREQGATISHQSKMILSLREEKAQAIKFGREILKRSKGQGKRLNRNGSKLLRMVVENSDLKDSVPQKIAAAEKRIAKETRAKTIQEMAALDPQEWLKLHKAEMNRQRENKELLEQNRERIKEKRENERRNKERQRGYGYDDLGW